jgi:sulfur transfer protein SufE
MTQDDFSSIDIHALDANRQWQSQYRLLMTWGDVIQTKPKLRTEHNKIRGCAASTWLALHNGQFYFDSDSRIIKGLAALLLAQINKGEIRIENLTEWEDLLQNLGLRKHLSPSRNNGLQALVRRMLELWHEAHR